MPVLDPLNVYYIYIYYFIPCYILYIIYIKITKITWFNIGIMSTMLSIEEMATSFNIES